jgi:hypothetical protein
MKTKAKKNSRAWTPERRKRQAATIAARKAGKAHVNMEKEVRAAGGIFSTVPDLQQTQYLKLRADAQRAVSRLAEVVESSEDGCQRMALQFIALELDRASSF